MKIIKFVKPSCTPCKVLNAYLEHEKLSVDEEINLIEDGALEIAKKYNVKGTPTLILLDDNGVEIQRMSGFNQKNVKDIFEKREGR